MSSKSTLNRGLGRVHTPEAVRALSTFLSSNIDTANTNITTLQGNVTTLQGNVTTLQSNVTSLQGVSWDNLVKVSGSDFTTSSTSLVDITGLVTPTLTANKRYYFEVALIGQSSSAAGVTFGMHFSSTLATITWLGIADNTGFASFTFINTGFDTATATLWADAAADVPMWARGFISMGANAGTVSARISKVTSGTATVRTGSLLAYKQVN